MAEGVRRLFVWLCLVAAAAVLGYGSWLEGKRREEDRARLERIERSVARCGR